MNAIRQFRLFGDVRGMAPNLWRSRNVYHTVASPEAAQGVLNGINPRFFNADSRFGRAFYVSEVPDTTLAELEHHGVAGVDTIRFNFSKGRAKILDLTKPRIAKKWGYVGGKISPETKEIGLRAREAGYNVIRYSSERGEGANLAFIGDFDKLLQSQMVVPAPDINIGVIFQRNMIYGGV